MKINYPEKISWRKSLTADIFANYGDSNRARLKSTLKKIPDSSITHTIVELNQEIVDWFTPLYVEAISSKSNPSLHEVAETTLHNPNGRTYYALRLFENNKPVGATIFSLLEDRLNITYRIFPHKWESAKLQANPSLYTDYILSEHAFSCGVHMLSHGTDRNMFGVNSSIGLAAFKLSVGCTPYMPKNKSVAEIDTTTIGQDTLLFSNDANETTQQIKTAHLFTSSETTAKWEQVTKYTEQIAVVQHIYDTSTH